MVQLVPSLQVFPKAKSGFSGLWFPQSVAYISYEGIPRARGVPAAPVAHVEGGNARRPSSSMSLHPGRFADTCVVAVWWRANRSRAPKQGDPMGAQTGERKEEAT